MSLDKKLDFWIKNNYNVLLVGKAGAGKTSMIKEAFTKAFGDKWKYFSASTMDPWVDFVGVPKEQQDENGPYLDLIRPKEFRDDEVEALVFDEFNRAPKKVKNSVMELIQFKSINGRKFKNLKIVWAAVNPDDDEDQKYDVEPIDPAQLDRFHVQYAVKYEPYLPYFSNKYGPEIAKAATSWWKDLDPKQKNLVSPRRLDYALDFYVNKGDMRDVLPSSTNVSKLLMEISSGPITEKLNSILKSQDKVEGENFLNNENNYAASINKIVGKAEMVRFFAPLIAEEKLISLLSNNNIQKDVLHNISDYYDKIYPIMGSIQKSKLKKAFIKELIKALTAHHKSLNPQLANPAANTTSLFKCYYHPKAGLADLNFNLLRVSIPSHNTTQRYRNYDILVNYLCADLTDKEAPAVLDLIADLVDKSQMSIMRSKMNKLGQMLNHVLDRAAKCGADPIKLLNQHFNQYCLKKVMQLKDFNFTLVQ